MASITNIAVIGAGLMGHGITMAFIRQGYRVSVFDPAQDILGSLPARLEASLGELGETDIHACLARVRLASSLEDCVANADFVTEAAPEKLELKQSIFAQLDAAAPAHCILASNTSVIPIGQIMAKVNNKQRAIGTHWWNPAHLIDLVEVIRTAEASDTAIDATVQLLTAIGKTPVRVEKDVPGFIGNRLQHALWREAISLVENGVCDAAAVDTVTKISFGKRLAVLGPLENADLVGTDLTVDIHNNVLHDLERSQGPSPYLQQLVSEQKLGMKSGQGFYQWSEEKANALRSKVVEHLAKK